MRTSHFAQMRTEPRPTGRILNLPALGFLVVFAVVAYGGANIVAFERLPGWVRSSPGQPVDSLAGPISTWKNTTGVATRARTLVLDIILAKTPGDTAAIENALDEVAKASPASVTAWQARAALSASSRRSDGTCPSGFRMSVLTGSHEGYYMTQRVKFGLEYWSELPEVDRRTVIRDLVGSATDAQFGPDRYRNIVAKKSQAERDDIRAAVMASGRGSKDALASTRHVMAATEHFGVARAGAANPTASPNLCHYN